ncbi:MAG: hypothetical protein LBK43_07870, partial [Treponema sp.]|nr:hypothetical protein [Treponema sp.]
YALRILNNPHSPQALLVVKGKAVKLKPPKKRPANRAGKKIYSSIFCVFFFVTVRTSGEKRS